MIRMLLVMVVAGVVGWLGAKFEAGNAFAGAKERFSSSRETYAERTGRITKEEILKAEGDPKVEVEGGTNFNFGTMKHGETRSHEFVIRNIGTGPLHLEMGQTTCKCTIGDLEESVLEPGEETQIRLTWTAQTLIRDFGQTAKIITTDPEATEVKLTVRGQVVDSFVLEPGELNFGDFLGTDGVSKTLYVVNYFEDDVDLEDLHWTDKKTVPLLDIKKEKLPMDFERFPQHTEAKGMFKIDVSVAPGMPLGRLKGRLRFSTTLGEDIGMIDVPTQGRATGDFSLIGGSSFNPMLNMVKFGTVEAKEGSSITIFARISEKLASRGKPEIAKVTPEGSLKASIGEGKKTGASVMFPIHLEIPKGADPVSLAGPKADQYGQVVLKIEGESGGELPVYCRMIIVE